MGCVEFESGHVGEVNGCEFDYYGGKVATCGTDGLVKIWKMEPLALEAELTGHDGSIWQVSWAHPRFGSVLASCSFDRKVIVWTQNPSGVWVMIYRYEAHSASVNSLAFAPSQNSLILAAGSSDGSTSVHTHDYTTNQWSVALFPAHTNGVNAVAWNPNSPTLQIVTAGGDTLVKIWGLSVEGEWELTDTLKGNKGWICDVAWKPNCGMSGNTVISSSEDGRLIFWTQESAKLPWSCQQTITLKAPLAKVSWSLTGSLLTVATKQTGQESLLFFKQNLQGLFEQVNSPNQ